MVDPARPDSGFIAIVTLRTDGPEQQRQLLDLLVPDVQEWVRHCPGFISANYHVSTDGTRLVNYAQWVSEEAYRESFKRNPRAGALRAALAAIPGVQGPEMTGYTLARSIPAAAVTEPA
ncbi:antibiotic biosynthesis monooxygenase [Micromonospora sediminicola]|uniref:antibiotic biosynthesis monooxygenase n=1 Tax=Micromonospora sediminicola TaxID=946078 RepID=UPI0033ADF01B